jgi:hypothetical protein
MPLQGRRIPLQGRNPHRCGYRSGFAYATFPANVVDYENIITLMARARLPITAPDAKMFKERIVPGATRHSVPGASDIEIIGRAYTPLFTCSLARGRGV